MREDSRVEIFFICGIGLAMVVHGVYAFWRGADDRDWARRWTSLDGLDRAWLAAASRSSANRATLEERGEFELAKGFGRREARHRSYIVLATALPFLVIAILMLSGLISDRFAPAAFGTFALAQSLIAYFRDRQIKKRYRETQNRYLPTPGADMAPTA